MRKQANRSKTLRAHRKWTFTKIYKSLQDHQMENIWKAYEEHIQR